MKRPPSCILHHAGDKHVLCGKKSADVPVCWARWVQAHIDGHNPKWCDECLTKWRRLRPGSYLR